LRTGAGADTSRESNRSARLVFIVRPPTLVKRWHGRFFTIGPCARS
jgi:hypothetical protein